MNVTITPHEHPLHPIYDIKIDIDFDIVGELVNEEWESITPTHLDDLYTRRYRLVGTPKSQKVSDMFDYFNSIEFKKVMMDLLWNDKEFHHKWGPRLDYNKIFNITKVEAGFHKDVPGFSTDLHLENRCQIAFGMVFFLGEDDEKRSTYFYTHADKSAEVRIPTSDMGAGWICVNTHKGWHQGSNNSDRERYSMSINYCFDMFHSDIVKPDDYTVRFIRGELD